MFPPTWFVKYISFPLWLTRDLGPEFIRNHLRYLNYNSYSENRIKQLQTIKLQNLLLYASQSIPFYRDYLQDLGPEYIQANPHETLRKLPLLTKDLIRKNEQSLKSPVTPPQRLLKDSTGGSTGVPLTFYRDRQCLAVRRAQEIFFDRWMGCDIGHKVALFVAARHHPAGLKGLKSRIRNSTSTRLLAFNPYRTDNEYMTSFYERLTRFKPDFIKCFPNSLFIFANFLKQNGLTNIRPSAISCTGETLHGHQRVLFQDVFQCPVFEKYGTFEVGVAACECNRFQGMHLFIDSIFFEFLNDRGHRAEPGELANIIVTDLANYGFPLLRYKIGDVGVYTDKKCPCGSPLPLMPRLFGRDRDILVDSEGNPKPGYLFVEIFNKNHIPGQFQVIQENQQWVRIKVARRDGFTRSHEDLILTSFSGLLGNSIKIDIEFVEQIQREDSGKYLYVHSKVSPF